MLDGFQYALAQIGAVVAITALLAGFLGWLIGRGSRRRTERAFERAVAAISPPEPDTSLFAPPSTTDDAAPDVEELPAQTAQAAEEEPEWAATPLAQHQPYRAEPIAHAPLHDIADPDSTVIRPAPAPKTPPYVPPSAVITSVPVTPTGTPSRPPASVQVATAEDVLKLRLELRNRDLELGRIEASAFSAWDRMVPRLEEQIEDLAADNVVLHRRIREAEEHSSSDVFTIERLRAVIADRDRKIADLRDQS